MARKVRAPRHPFGTSGRFGELLPIHRQIVAPGESMKRLKLDCRIQSAPVRNYVTGAYVDAWFFYVPMRFVWDDWADFIMGDTSLSVPTCPDPQPSFFQTDGGKSNLFARAYGECVNGYFRSDEDLEYDATTNIPAYAPRADLTAEYMTVQGVDNIDVEIDTADGLSVEEIDWARAEFRYKKKMKEASGHYADFLKMHGVNARAADVLQPESIGHVRAWTYPSKSIDQNTGLTVQSYFADLKATFNKSRYFPEHGYIVGIGCVRPKMYPVSCMPVEDVYSGPEEWPHKGQLSQHRMLDHPRWLADVAPSTDIRHYTDNFLKHGQMLVGEMQEGHLTYDPPGRYPARVPQNAAYSPMLSGASPMTGGSHYAVDGVVASSIASPLPLVAKV